MDRKGPAFSPLSTEKMESATSSSVTQIVTQKNTKSGCFYKSESENKYISPTQLISDTLSTFNQHGTCNQCD